MSSSALFDKFIKSVGHMISENPFIDLRQSMHVGQELDDSHHASTHTNVQRSLMETEKMLLHCILTAFGNAGFGPPTNDDKIYFFYLEQ